MNEFNFLDPIFAPVALTALAASAISLTLVPVWDRASEAYVKDLREQLSRLGMNEAFVTSLMRAWGVALVASVVVPLVAYFNVPLAIFAVGLTAYGPRFIIAWLVARRRRLLRDQMVGVATQLANASRAGLSLPQGLESVARDSPEPIAAELRRIYRDYDLGMPLDEAIQTTSNRLQLDGFSIFSAVLLVSVERGGRVTEALDRISRSLEEICRLERNLEAQTASGRLVVVILSLFPFGFLAFFGMMDPTGVGLMFTTTAGQVLFGIICVIVLISAWISSRILAIEF